MFLNATGPSEGGGICGSAGAQTVSDMQIFFCRFMFINSMFKTGIFSCLPTRIGGLRHGKNQRRT